MERSRLITFSLIVFSVSTVLVGKNLFGLSTNEVFAVCLVAFGVHLLSWVCSYNRITYALSPLISFLLAVSILQITKSGGDIAAGIPTPGAFFDLLEHLRDGLTQMKSQSTPFSGNTQVFLIAILGIWALAEIGETSAQRLRLATPTIGVYIVVIALLNDNYLLSVVVVATTCILFLFAFHRNYEHTRSHLVEISNESTIYNATTYSVLGFIAIALSLLLVIPVTNLPSLAPDDPFDFINPNSRTEVTPLVGMRDLLQSDTNDVMFTAKTSQAQYWRLAVLDSFNNEVWEASDEDEATPETIPDTLETTKISGSILLEGLKRKYLPSIYSVSNVNNDKIEFLRHGVLKTDDDSLSSYSFTSNMPPKDLNQNQIDASSEPPPGSVESSLLFPKDLDPEIISTARGLVQSKSSIYEQAIALRDFFLDGSFSYDLTANYSNEDQPMKAFLEKRKGFCEQFAATYAAMARSVGIPARVIVGFTPGDADGSGTFTIREKQAHSWVEVYLSNFGWLTIEPTPSGTLPGQAPTNIGSTVTTTSTSTAQTTVPVSSSQSTATTTPQKQTKQSAKSSTNLAFIVILLAGAGLLVFVLRKKLSKRDTNKYASSVFKEISAKVLDNHAPIDLTIDELRGKIPTANKDIHIFLDDLSEASYMPGSKISDSQLRKSAEKARSEKIKN